MFNVQSKKSLLKSYMLYGILAHVSIQKEFSEKSVSAKNNFLKIWVREEILGKKTVSVWLFAKRGGGVMFESKHFEEHFGSL